MRERPVNGKVRTTFAFYALPHAEKHAALGNVLSREALVRNTVSSNFCGHSQTRRGIFVLQDSPVPNPLWNRVLSI